LESGLTARKLEPADLHWGALKGNLRLAESQHKQALISIRQQFSTRSWTYTDALIGIPEKP